MKLNIIENSTIICFGDSLTYGHRGRQHKRIIPNDITGNN
jgi:hypothetical protein